VSPVKKTEFVYLAHCTADFRWTWREQNEMKNQLGQREPRRAKKGLFSRKIMFSELLKVAFIL